MKLFRDDGHLTDEALTALAGESLDDLSRLEIAEHLAFCDLCLQRYTLALEPQPLLTPSRSCRESLMRRIRERTLHLITSRRFKPMKLRQPRRLQILPGRSAGVRRWIRWFPDGIHG